MKKIMIKLFLKSNFKKFEFIHFKWSGKWYNEYQNHVRIHDYFSIMINQFPIFVIRELYFDLHEDESSIVLSIAFIGFTLGINYKILN